METLKMIALLAVFIFAMGRCTDVITDDIASKIECASPELSLIHI